MTGELGFDEGGVLEALSKGGGSQIVETFKYDRKGNVISKTTTSIEITATHVVVALLLAGIITLGPDAAQDIKEGKYGPNIFSVTAMLKELWGKYKP